MALKMTIFGSKKVNFLGIDLIIDPSYLCIPKLYVKLEKD